MEIIRSGLSGKMKDSRDVLIRSIDTYKSRESAFREIIYNAKDAGATKIVVSIYNDNFGHTPGGGYITISDNGCGMSYGVVRDSFIGFFGSTKSENEVAIGEYGIGAKSILAFYNRMNVTTVSNGKMTSFSMYRSDKDIMAAIYEESVPTDQPNGTSITIPYDDNMNGGALYPLFERFSFYDPSITLRFSGVVKDCSFSNSRMLFEEAEIMGRTRRVWLNPDTFFRYKPDFAYSLMGYEYIHGNESDVGVVIETFPGELHYTTSRDSVIQDSVHMMFADAVDTYMASAHSRAIMRLVEEKRFPSIPMRVKDGTLSFPYHDDILLDRLGFASFFEDNVYACYRARNQYDCTINGVEIKRRKSDLGEWFSRNVDKSKKNLNFFSALPFLFSGGMHVTYSVLEDDTVINRPYFTNLFHGKFAHIVFKSEPTEEQLRVLYAAFRGKVVKTPLPEPKTEKKKASISLSTVLIDPDSFAMKGRCLIGKKRRYDVETVKDQTVLCLPVSKSSDSSRMLFQAILRMCANGVVKKDDTLFVADTISAAAIKEGEFDLYFVEVDEKNIKTGALADSYRKALTLGKVMSPMMASEYRFSSPDLSSEVLLKHLSYCSSHPFPPFKKFYDNLSAWIKDRSNELGVFIWKQYSRPHQPLESLPFNEGWYETLATARAFDKIHDDAYLSNLIAAYVAADAEDKAVLLGLITPKVILLLNEFSEVTEHKDCLPDNHVFTEFPIENYLTSA